MRGPAVEIDRVVREVLGELPATGSADIAARHRPANGNGTGASPRGPEVQLPVSAWNNGRSAVVTLSDLDGRLDAQGELVVPKNTIVTPLAREYLNERGVTIKHGAAEAANQAPSNEKTNASSAGWAYAILDASGVAEGAVQAVVRQGTQLTPIAADCLRGALRACADGLATGKLCGAILISDDAALAACAANKRPGIRAAVAQSPQQAARARETLAANVLVVEPTGKTLHELRNMLRTFCHAAALQPPPDVAELLGDR
jgi:hypothetical protein